MFGANPESRDRAGLTPLMKAARQRKVILSIVFISFLIIVISIYLYVYRLL